MQDQNMWDLDTDFLLSVLPNIIKNTIIKMLTLIKKYKMYEPNYNFRYYSSHSYVYSSQNNKQGN